MDQQNTQSPQTDVPKTDVPMGVGPKGLSPNGQPAQSPGVVIGMDFSQAIRKVIDGKRIRRPDWGAWYGLLKDERLKLWKPDEQRFVDWIVSEGDMIALDWQVVE